MEKNLLEIKVKLKVHSIIFLIISIFAFVGYVKFYYESYLLKAANYSLDKYYEKILPITITHLGLPFIIIVCYVWYFVFLVNKSIDLANKN